MNKIENVDADNNMIKTRLSNKIIKNCESVLLTILALWKN